MSKFFVTNNKDWFVQIKHDVDTSPFKINGVYVSDCIYAITTKKLQVDNINFFHDGEDFIIQTGTCVYKEMSGEDALKVALQDFSGDVQVHRENYIGNYGCVIKKGNTIVAFNEATAFYDVFYYHKNQDWIIGTSIVDLGKVLAKRISVNKLNVLEELTRFAIFDNDTYFTEVKRLSGDQYLELSSTDLCVKPLNLGIIQDNPSDYDTRSKNIAREMKYIAGVMYKNFGQTSLGCTGGFDSRMTLAAYLAADIKPKIAYGYGNSSLAQSKMGDVEVDKEYSRRYGLELDIAPWNETLPIDKKWDEYIDKYGKVIYDGNEDAFNFYTNIDEKFLSFGYTAELFREDNWSKDITDGKMTFEDYLWKNHSYCNRNIIEASPDLMERWLRKWKKLNAEHGVEEKYFNKRDLFWLCLAYRHSADNHMINQINLFKYAHYLMSDIRIVRNGYVDFDKKYNGQFMIQMLNEVYPDILNVPFFTHCHKMQYNPQFMKVEELRTNSVRSIISNLIPKNIKKRINIMLGRHMASSEFSDSVFAILEKEGNEEKLRRLVGNSAFNSIERTGYNLTFVVRGIILCKTFDAIGVKY